MIRTLSRNIVPKYLAKLCLVLFAAAILTLPRGWCCAAMEQTFPANQAKTTACCQPQQDRQSETPANRCHCSLDKAITTVLSQTSVDFQYLTLVSNDSPWEINAPPAILLRETESSPSPAQPLRVLLCVWICWFVEIADYPFQLRISFKSHIYSNEEISYVFKNYYRYPAVYWSGNDGDGKHTVCQPELLWSQPEMLWSRFGLLPVRCEAELLRAGLGLLWTGIGMLHCRKRMLRHFSFLLWYECRLLPWRDRWASSLNLISDLTY